MIYQYEVACKEAGMSEEQIHEIRKMFDAEKKKLKRRNKQLEEEKEKYGFGIYSLSGMHGQDEEDDFEPADPNVDVEASVLKKIQKEQLHEFLGRLNAEDAQFLLLYYEGHGSIQKACDLLGMTRPAAARHRDKLLGQLRDYFGVEIKK